MNAKNSLSSLSQENMGSITANIPVDLPPNVDLLETDYPLGNNCDNF